MSITFTSDVRVPDVVSTEPCLCAQAAPDFMLAASETLRRFADPACWSCRGEGVEVMSRSGQPELNVANGNAFRLLAFLRLIDDAAYLSVAPTAQADECVPHRRTTTGRSRLAAPGVSPDLWGAMALPLFRRAVLRARNTFGRRVPHFVRRPEFIRTVRRNGNSIALHEVASIAGLDRDRFTEYLSKLEELCAFAERHGGSEIRWS